jgi:ACS family allantoate permease-like MFS transporter
MAACMAVSTLNIVAWKLWLIWMNRKKDREVAAMNLTEEEKERKGQELGAMDVTDMKNPFFK